MKLSSGCVTVVLRICVSNGIFNQNTDTMKWMIRNEQWWRLGWDYPMTSCRWTCWAYSIWRITSGIFSHRNECFAIIQCDDVECENVVLSKIERQKHTQSRPTHDYTRIKNVCQCPVLLEIEIEEKKRSKNR